MYEKVSIYGFRGIDYVELDRLRHLNILVGRNNTGKSACLEAVSLMSSGPHMFKDAFGRSALEHVLGRGTGTDKGAEHLLHDGGKTAMVKGVQASGAADTLEIAGSLDDMENTPPAEQAGELESKIRGGVPGEDARRATYFYSRGSTQTLAGLYAAAGSIMSEAVGDGPRAGAGFNLFIRSPDLVPHRPGAVSANMGDMAARLKMKLSDIDDIRQKDGEIYVRYKDGSDMPLSRSGDGLRAALLMSTYRLEGCTISMEEPENHMHPALISYVVDELLMGCRDSGNQVFLSTQSDDLIEHALKAGSLEQVSVLQMIKEGGKTYTQPYAKHETYEHRVKLGQDIRDVYINDQRYMP